MRWRRVLAAVSLLLAPVSPASADAAQRLYLLGDGGDFLGWSVDALDPELPLTRITRTCGGGVFWGSADAKNCLSGLDPTTGYFHSLFFSPRARIDEPVSWNASVPLRFRLTLGVNAALPYTVHFLVLAGAMSLESPPATEVTPGVWEGVIGTPGSLAPRQYLTLGARVRTRAPRISMDLSAGGASWLELPAAVAARSVPEMLAASAHRPAPSSYASALRAFDFNDDDWEVVSADGDLSSPQTLSVVLHRPAAVVVGWADLFRTPFVDDAVRGRTLDMRKLSDAAHLSMTLDGEEIAHGGNIEGEPGRGGDVAAAVGVEAGELRLTVTPSDDGETFPYTAHLLVVYGARTLGGMRWSFMLKENNRQLAHRSPVSAICPAGPEVIPLTEEVTTFAVDLDWATAGLPQRWTLRYVIPNEGFFPCAEAGNGSRMRFVLDGPDVFYVGPTPARDTTFVSWRDTVFEMAVAYAYTAA